jgi:hypothetical protein
MTPQQGSQQQGSQPHRRDEVYPDGTWYDHVDQADCCESPVIAALPARRPLAGFPVVAVNDNGELQRQVPEQLARSLPSDDPDDG